MKLLFITSLLFTSNIYAHHSKDHMMLMADAETIILNTQQGTESGLFWLLWGGAFFLLLMGFFRWWKGRS